MDLDEFISHIERGHTIKTLHYAIKANGYVDPSTWVHHRYIVLTIEHRSVTGSSSALTSA